MGGDVGEGACLGEDVCGAGLEKLVGPVGVEVGNVRDVCYI